MEYKRLKKWFKHEGREDICISGLDTGIESQMQFFETCLKATMNGWKEIEPIVIKVKCLCYECPKKRHTMPDNPGGYCDGNSYAELGYMTRCEYFIFSVGALESFQAIKPWIRVLDAKRWLGSKGIN